MLYFRRLFALLVLVAAFAAGSASGQWGGGQNNGGGQQNGGRNNGSQNNGGQNNGGQNNASPNNAGNANDNGQKYPGVWSGLNRAGGDNAGEAAFGSRDDAPEAPVRPAGLSDAKDNFGSLVASYLSERGGKLSGRKLKLITVDKNSVAKRGRGIFVARAKMRPSGGAQPIDVYFTADFSGADWHVTGYSFKAPGRRKR